MRVPYTYLPEQFGPHRLMTQAILAEITDELTKGRFTLGPQVERLEEAWAAKCGTKYAIGVNSGTDALKLLYMATAVDGIATVTNTFVATVGAALELGKRVRLIDDGDLIMARNGNEAYVPVHWAGEMLFNVSPAWNKMAGGVVIEDACQAIGASYKGKMAGSFGIGAAFSLHPLKNVNVWGDGGMVTTSDEGLAQEIRLLRNHGLSDRDTVAKPGINSRLDTIQAIVGYHSLAELDAVTAARQVNALYYDRGLSRIPQVTVPDRDSEINHVYHLYQVEVTDRDELVAYLNERGVEAKVHYKTPLHLQPGLAFLGYKEGDFPVAEAWANNHVTLPVHQYLEVEQLRHVIDTIGEFYARPALS